MTGTGGALTAFAFAGGNFFTTTAMAFGGTSGVGGTAGLREKRVLRLSVFFLAAGLTPGAETGAVLVEGRLRLMAGAAAAGYLAIFRGTTGEAGTFRVSAEAG